MSKDVNDVGPQFMLKGHRRPFDAPAKGSSNGENIPEPTPLAWEPPTPFDDRTVPAFPTDSLAPWLKDWVQAEARATQTPVDLPGMLAIAVLSTASAKKLRVRVRPGFEEPLNTYGAVVLPPANRKTAVFGDATAPGVEFEREEVERQRDDIGQTAQRRRILEARLEKMERDAARADDEAQRAVTRADANSVRMELAGVHVPAEPRYFVDDITPEKLTMMLAEQNGRISQLSPEGDVFDMMAGRYSANANFAVYLKGHAGDDMRVDRAGRPPDYVRQPAITLGLAVQPEVIRGLMARSDFRGRGLCGRFLYSVPKSPLGHRQVGAPPVSESVWNGYRSGVRALFAMPFGEDAQRAPVANILSFEPAANRVLMEFESELEPRLGPHGDLGWMGDWAGKLVGQVARLAGLLHLADHVNQSEPWTTLVSADCVRRAITLGRYLIAHAQVAYGTMGADPDVAGADHLLGWIERTRPERFTKRAAHQENRGRFHHADDVAPALDLLEEHGFVRRVPDEKPGKQGGRPSSPAYQVNPHAFSGGPPSQNSHNTHNLTNDSSSEGCESSERGVPLANGVAGPDPPTPPDEASARNLGGVGDDAA